MAAVMGGRRGARRDYWKDQIEGWKQSGQSERAYCEERGLNPVSFYRWFARLRKAEPASEGPRFIPVRLAASQGVGSAVELTFPNG